MATALLVERGANRLRYLITAIDVAPETAIITTIGGVSPDVLTDSVGGGTLKKISKVVAAGYAQFAAGVQTQAKARALWTSNWAGADPGNLNTVTAICRVTPRSVGAGADACGVDANVNAGNPEIVVTISGGGTAYLDIEVPGTIGN